jgi:hypothetical protein
MVFETPESIRITLINAPLIYLESICQEIVIFVRKKQYKSLNGFWWVRKYHYL